jgi:hypothetical protein
MPTTTTAELPNAEEESKFSSLSVSARGLRKSLIPPIHIQWFRGRVLGIGICICIGNKYEPPPRVEGICRRLILAFITTSHQPPPTLVSVLQKQFLCPQRKKQNENKSVIIIIMPHLRLETSVPKVQIPRDFPRELLSVVAKTLGKAEEVS